MDSPISLLVPGSLLIPAVAALTLPAETRFLRRVAAAACAAATLLAASAAAGMPAAGLDADRLSVWIQADRMTAIGMAVYAAVAAAAFLMTPSRDITRTRVAAALSVVSATLLTLASGNPLVLAIGWTASALPFVVGPFAVPGNWRPRAALAASALAVVAGCALMIGGSPTDGIESFTALTASRAGGVAAFACLVIGLILRKGIVPAHAWVADLTETGALPTTLLLTEHLGALLLARVLLPIFPEAVSGSTVLLSDLALVTALYAAVRAVAEPSARRVVALVVLSQTACILAGMESGTSEGLVGALVHLSVVSVATMALFGILRAVEARAGEVDTARYGGLVHAAPRLAVCFAISGLAMVGLPGTLGFAAEDLLIHGSLMSHPQVGLLLPMATALNAVVLFRLFARIFLGARRPLATGIVDALPRERLVLTAVVLALVVGGALPRVAVSWSGRSAVPTTAAAQARHVVMLR